MQKIEDYTNTLSTLTYFINTSIIQEILSKPETAKVEPYKFLYTVLLKSNNTLDTCSLLLANFSEKPHFVDSLIILLRSVISDSVIVWYLIVKSEGDDQKFNENIRALYYDHIQT